MPMALADLQRLANVLGLLGSPHAGERDAAALAADRLVRGRGLTWKEILCGSTAPPVRRAASSAPPRGWRADLTLAQAHLAQLNGWEREFVLSISANRSSLSPGQQAKLAEIAAELRHKGFAGE